MIAVKVPPRKDGKSSAARLKEYITKREDPPKPKDTNDDKRSNSLRERGRAVLNLAREHLREAEAILSGLRTIDRTFNAAVRGRLADIERALNPLGPGGGELELDDRHEPGDDGLNGPGGVNGTTEIERHLALARNHLEAADHHLRAPRRDKRVLAARARARQAYLACVVAAATRRALGDAGSPGDALTFGRGINYISRDGVECSTNCITLETASLEMDAVSGLNPRVKEPLYHLIISWSEGENPDAAEAFGAVSHTLEALGFADHQYVAAIHRDTDNVHAHVMINRVHPETGKAHSPSHDHYVMDKAMRELEIRYGRAHANGPYVVVERNGRKVVVRADLNPDIPRPPKRQKRPHPAEQMEEFAGEESLHTYARGAPRIAIVAVLKKQDLDWAMLHAELARFGLTIQPKGKGLGIFAIGAEITPIKASSMHEDLSLTRLVRRLGDYQAPAPTSDSLEPSSDDELEGIQDILEDLEADDDAYQHAAADDGTNARERDRSDPTDQGDDVGEQSDARPSGSHGPRSSRYHRHANAPEVDAAQGHTSRGDPKREQRKAERAEARARLKGRYDEYRQGFVRRRVSAEDVTRRMKELNRTFAARRADVRNTPGTSAQRRTIYSLITLEAAQAREALKLQIAKEKAALRKDPTNQPLTYRDWVEVMAQQGDEAALAQMRGWAYAERRHRTQEDRARKSRADPGTESDDVPEDSFVFLKVMAHEIRRDGSVVYWQGNDRAFVDHGRAVRMVVGAEEHEANVLAALKFSQAKFRGTFRLTGDADYIAQAVELIARHKLRVTLNDALQARALAEARQRYAHRPGSNPSGR